jgi:hypothetical protein
MYNSREKQEMNTFYEENLVERDHLGDKGT